MTFGLDDLNPAQREAVTWTGGPLLVVAGAGSGKTRVITRRIAWRVAEGLRPSEVLAITFTNKAAGEMKARVDQLVGRSAAWISTFHSFGARFLRIEAEAAGLERNFTIYDAADQLTVVREVAKELRLPSARDDVYGYLDRISRWKNAGAAPIGDGEDSSDAGALVYRGYAQQLQLCQALDFDDLLYRTVRVLEDREDVRARFAARFKTLLIDEYQDTNRLQYRLARLLVRDHGDICATGDPDQSIYRWRGAEIRNILEFERDFPGTKVVKLEENYRSTNQILKAASAVIRNNRERIDRELRSSLGEGEAVRVWRSPNDSEEARRIAESVREEMRDGRSASDIAIFYRTNACTRVLERAMRDANVPYEIVGAVEFYERREVKDLLGYLRVLVNPYDAVDLTRIINVPSRGIGPKTLELLRRAAEAAGRPLRDQLLAEGRVPGLRAAAELALRSFRELFRDLLASPPSPVLPLLDAILDRSDYRGWLCSQDDPASQDRLDNVEELRRALAEYDAEHPGGTLAEFLAETALLRSRQKGIEGEPRATLMTLHSAKGLEFPVVYVAALEEGIMPHSRSSDSEGGLEEERRLMYVGITRAERRLTLSCALARSFHGGGLPVLSLASRFLDEIPAELCEGDLGNRWTESVSDPGNCYEPEACGDEPPFQVGDRVLHDHFGAGKVLDASGYGPSAKVTVAFDLAGTKRLLLEFARLKKARA